MLNRDTVLVLGAGASFTYGFPLGIKLRDIAVKRFLTVKSKDKELLENLELEPDEIREFAKALLYSGQQSVDRFVEMRAEYMDIGKIIIALILIEYEDRHLLFPTIPVKNHWYEYLFNKLNINEIPNNRLKIITFNYDRSLEYYLTTTIAYSKNIDMNAALDLLSDIPILHVHGKLGDLDFSGQNGRQYNTSINKRTIKHCLRENGIKIIKEVDAGSQEYTKAREWLRSADCIIFLGFGYDEENLYRLGMKDYFRHIKQNRKGNRPYIIGSAVGKTASECNDINTLVNGVIELDYTCNDNLGFLKKHSPLK